MLATPARAIPLTNQPQTTFRFQYDAAAGIATIECMEEPAFRLRGPDAAKRAQRVVEALRQGFFAAESLPPPSTVSGDPEPLLALGGLPFLTVTREEAKANNTDPKSLAALWRANLERVFDRWRRKPFPGKLTVPLGGVLQWRVGKSTEQLRAADFDPSMVSVEAGGGRVLLRGHASGETQCTISWGDLSASMTVTVLPIAADAAAPAQLALSHPNLPDQAVQAAVRLAARSVIRAQPGATVSAELLPAAGTQRRVRVQATAPQTLDFLEDIPVEMGYRPLVIEPCGELFVSNAPERVATAGGLFGSALTGTSRLLYHHLNDTARSLVLLVELVNLGEVEREVGVVVSAAGPSTDEMHVGHKAARDFLQRRSRAEGFTLRVAGGASVPLVEERFQPRGILSGLLELLPSGPTAGLAVRVRATEIGGETRQPSRSMETPQFVFSQPDIRQDASYDVGGRWAFVTIGRHAITGKTGTYQLAGNYGVLHDLSVTARNPTPTAAQVKLLFAPAGGVARGTFVVAGKHVEAPVTRSGTESLLEVFSLPPQSERTIRVITMPESASNYPIRLVVRAD